MENCARAGALYVAGLDCAGEEEAALDAGEFAPAARRDSAVLTVARLERAAVELSKSTPVVQASAGPKLGNGATRPRYRKQRSYTAAGEGAQQESRAVRRRPARDDGG